ncbi:MAG TPA: glycogen debranching N-terminal domain-containing protein [Acidimicrobiales bacterium]|nr:glycogen debranching N-terminal domain-containing protein [Acidimicrobiales bacterium]
MSESPYTGRTPVATVAAGGAAVTLVEGQTFCVSAANGDLHGDQPMGLFVMDTRVLSRWELRLNGHRPETLTVAVTEPFAATFVARGRAGADRADSDLLVLRERHIGQGMRERIRLTNHGLEPASVVVEVICDVDFADLFEVKESRVQPRGLLRCDLEPSTLHFRQSTDRGSKAVIVTLSEPASVEPGVITWRVQLAPGRSWEACAEVAVTLNGSALEPRFPCDGDGRDAVPAIRLAAWRATLPTVDTDHEGLVRTIRRSGEDLGALRIFDPEHPDTPILAAGAPWFMTVFGRDSILTAWMTLIADPTLAEGVLRTLARFQGDDVNPQTEEEPGKILHEMRFGGAGGLALGGGDVYYGSVDATPLFVMLLGELRRWDLDDDVVAELLPNADRALEWIERFGDRDGDGYVEYERLSDEGLANQGWKDSWDAIRFADGRLAGSPIALCEVQGYVYAAYVARAHFAREAEDEAAYERWAAKAAGLRQRFNEDFWLDEHGWCALALDGDKRPVDALASNMGHLLWTGILDADRAAIVADRLLSPELFSGWGIRTLASSMPAHNPVSYHNGSVWPHDNALCAAGLARYGFVEHAHRVIDAQLAVAEAFGGRLPELFAGLAREEIPVPAAYPASCSPQAWASASPLLWLRTMLRLDPWTPHDQVWLHPELPPSVRRLRVSGIVLGERRLSISVDGDAVEVDVTGPSGLEVIRRARPPLTEALRPA